MSCNHAYKKQPAPVVPVLSFVSAVREMGDLWWVSRHVSRLPIGLRDEATRDRHEAALMSLMEDGYYSREGFADDRISVKDYTNAYPPMFVYAVGNLGWMATRNGYDSGDPLGTGSTRYAAIAALLEWELLDVEAREEG